MSRTAGALVALCCAAIAGCAPTATFVSPDPPPGVTVETVFGKSVPAVTAAFEKAMRRTDVTLQQRPPGGGAVVGTRQQVPYVGEGVDVPAPGALPVYRVTAVVTERRDTRVRASVDVICPACDGVTPYEWEYPTNLLRAVVEKARDILQERGHQVAYPPRHRPAKWRPAKHP